MKRLNLFLDGVTSEIKKKFFKSQKHDISHKKLSGAKRCNTVYKNDNLKQIDEYICTYTATTRWQTL